MLCLRKELEDVLHMTQTLSIPAPKFSPDTPQADGGLRSLLKMQLDSDLHSVYIHVTAMVKTL